LLQQTAGSPNAGGP